MYCGFHAELINAFGLLRIFLCADPVIEQDLGKLLSVCDFLGGDKREFSVKNRKRGKLFGAFVRCRIS